MCCEISRRNVKPCSPRPASRPPRSRRRITAIAAPRGPDQSNRRGRCGPKAGSRPSRGNHDAFRRAARPKESAQRGARGPVPAQLITQTRRAASRRRGISRGSARLGCSRIASALSQSRTRRPGRSWRSAGGLRGEGAPRWWRSCSPRRSPRSAPRRAGALCAIPSRAPRRWRSPARRDARIRRRAAALAASAASRIWRALSADEDASVRAAWLPRERKRRPLQGRRPRHAPPGGQGCGARRACSGWCSKEVLVDGADPLFQRRLAEVLGLSVRELAEAEERGAIQVDGSPPTDRRKNVYSMRTSPRRARR